MQYMSVFMKSNGTKNANPLSLSVDAKVQLLNDLILTNFDDV